MIELTQIIINWLKVYYLIEATALVLFPLGADPNASIYKVQASDKTYFVKLKRGHFPGINIEVIHLLQKNGIKQLISPIKTVDGTEIQQVDGYTLMVYPFVEGRDGFSQALTEAQWIQLGRTLKQMHEVSLALLS